MKSSQGEIAAAVLAKAGAAGFAVSEGQLRRWHQLGLLPKPNQNWVEGIPGSESIYPTGTGDQLCALCVIQQDSRSSANDWGWKLWWLGFPIDKKYWNNRMKAQAKLLDKNSKRIVQKLGSDGPDDRGRFVESLRNARTRNIPFRRLRKRLGSKHFDGMVGFIVQILEGTFSGWSLSESQDPDAIRDKIMVRKIFGIRRTKSIREAVNESSMQDDLEGVIQMLSDKLSSLKMTDVFEKSVESQIVRTRTQLRVLLFTVGGMNSSEANSVFGIEVLANLAATLLPNGQASFLLYLLALNRDIEFQNNLAVFLDKVRRPLPRDFTQQQINYLRSTDPAVASFAFPP